MLISHAFQVKFLKIIALKTGQIPQKYHLMSNFREALGLVKILKFRISCFEMTRLGGCCRQLLLIH